MPAVKMQTDYEARMCNGVANHLREALIRVRHVKDLSAYKSIISDEVAKMLEHVYTEIDTIIDHVTTPA